MNDAPRIATPHKNYARGWYVGIKDENRVRSMAQSILTHFFDRPEPPPYKQAVDIVKWAQPAM